MKRLRWVFIALAIGLWLPMVVLVRGALQAVAVEREVRHQTLAERVFDEMERQLGDLSERETNRSFTEYGFYLGDAADASRSPLSRPPSESYVVGYFQIDPAGALSIPRIPSDPARAIARGDWRATEHSESDWTTLKRLAREGIRSRQQWVAKSQSKQLGAAAFETEVGSLVADELQVAQLDADVEADDDREAVDSYQVAVRSLNRAKDRKLDSKRTEYAFAPSAPVASTQYHKEEVGRSRARAQALLSSPRFSQSMDRDTSAREGVGNTMPPRVAAFEEKIEQRMVRVGEPVGRRGDLSVGQKIARLIDKPTDKRKNKPAPSPVNESIHHPITEAVAIRSGKQVVEVDSMVGHWVEDRVAGADLNYIVLHRTATLAGRLYRQGLVVDVARLADWLRETVLRGTSLEGATKLELVSSASGVARRTDSSGYSYRQKFADPFGELTVALSLPVLADAGGAGYLYLISGLLMIVGTVGLFALYRMVAVMVAFSERRSDFVAAVSHELKTPLTAIRMYGEMLRDGMVPTEAKRHEYYATITAESERLTRLINNVLEFSHIEQGTREMSVVAGAIGPVIAEAAALLEPHAREQGFAIEIDIAPDLPAVRFDRDALLQVVFNLVDNALKYARGAEDRVIRLDARQTGDRVILRVRDRGPGVPADHLKKIFEPFYRGQKEMTRTEKGTGIGLALVKGLCERMGAVVAGRNDSQGGFEVQLTFRLA